MPKLTDQMIFARIQQAMQPQAQPVAGKVSPTTMDSIIEKAKAKRGATPEIKMTDGQKVDLKVRGM